MNANKQDAGGLPPQHGMARRLELAADRIAERAPEDNARLFRDAAQCIQTLFNVKEALQGELCRAAPAGSGEVGELIDRLETEARLLVGCIGRSDLSSDVRALRDAAALLRKLQQGADHFYIEHVYIEHMCPECNGDPAACRNNHASQGQEGGHAGASGESKVLAEAIECLSNCNEELSTQGRWSQRIENAINGLRALSRGVPEGK